MATITSEFEIDTSQKDSTFLIIDHEDLPEKIEIELSVNNTYSLITELIDWLGGKAGA